MIRIGTRGSRLALWQAERTRDVLVSLHRGLQVEIVPIKSHGDEAQHAPIQELQAVGIFTREIERALLDGQVDVAVQSLKDLPTESPPELVLAALLPRDDPRDTLIAGALRGFDDSNGRAAISALPRAARIGSGLCGFVHTWRADSACRVAAAPQGRATTSGCDTEVAADFNHPLRGSSQHEPCRQHSFQKEQDRCGYVCR